MNADEIQLVIPSPDPNADECGEKVTAPTEVKAVTANQGSTQQLLREEVPVVIGNFSISLLEIGDCPLCICSIICPCYAMGLARSFIDQSDPCFTCFCMNPCVLRWIIQSALNIPQQGAMQECLQSTFLAPCVINQAAQTAQRHTRSRIRAVNRTLPTSPNEEGSIDCCCLYCNQADVLMHSMNMPPWLAYCCVNPYLGRNLLRYQFEIGEAGKEFEEDCCVGICFCLVGVAMPCLCCPCYELNLDFKRAKLESDNLGVGSSYLHPYNSPDNVHMPTAERIAGHNQQQVRHPPPPPPVQPQYVQRSYSFSSHQDDDRQSAASSASGGGSGGSGGS